jgi:hypothetical protein
VRPRPKPQPHTRHRHAYSTLSACCAPHHTSSTPVTLPSPTRATASPSPLLPPPVPPSPRQGAHAPCKVARVQAPPQTRQQLRRHALPAPPRRVAPVSRGGSGARAADLRHGARRPQLQHQTHARWQAGRAAIRRHAIGKRGTLAAALHHKRHLPRRAGGRHPHAVRPHLHARVAGHAIAHVAAPGRSHTAHVSQLARHRTPRRVVQRRLTRHHANWARHLTRHHAGWARQREAATTRCRPLTTRRSWRRGRDAPGGAAERAQAAQRRCGREATRSDTSTVRFNRHSTWRSSAALVTRVRSFLPLWGSSVVPSHGVACGRPRRVRSLPAQVPPAVRPVPRHRRRRWRVLAVPAVPR